MPHRAWIAPLLAGALLAPPAAALAAPHDLVLASRASGPAGAKADDGIILGADLSADARAVAFWSWSTNLHPDDTGADSDLYVRDLGKDAATVLASRATGERGAKAVATFFANGPSLSGDGRRMAFSADAPQLSPSDTDAIEDVYVRDLTTHDTILVSRASGNGAKADGRSMLPALSGDGRLVAFVSEATNLTADSPGVPTVYLRDLETGTTMVAARADGVAGVPVATGGGAPAISADGRYVAFATRAMLDPADRNGRWDVHVRDLKAGTTVLASRATGRGGAIRRADSIRPQLSADGRTVAFESRAPLDAADANASWDVYVRDRATSATTLASRTAAGADGDGDSRRPALSADGRRVAYQSAATNLSAADADAALDVFVQDLSGLAGPMLVSRAAGSAGAGGDGSSTGPSLSGDGRFVAFGSRATNLDPADPDADTDVYVRELAPARLLLPGAVAATAQPARGGDRAKVARFLRGRRFSTFRSAAGDPPSSIERHYDFCPRGRVRYESTFLNTELEEPAIDIRTGTWQVVRARISNGFGTARIRLVADTGERGAIVIEASPRGFRIGGEIAEVTRSPICGPG